MFYKNPFNKQLHKLMLEYELEISKLPYKGFADESVQMMNEVVDRNYENSVNKSFTDMIYSKFKFPAIKYVFIPGLKSNISDIQKLFNNDSIFNSKDDKYITDEIIKLLDIKDIFKDFDSVQSAINASYSSNYLLDIQEAIENCVNDIIMDKDDARDYFLTHSLEFGIRTVYTYYENNENLGNSINKISMDYEKFYREQIRMYNNLKDENSGIDTKIISRKRRFIEELNHLLAAISKFSTRYANVSAKSGISLIKLFSSIHYSLKKQSEKYKNLINKY